MYYISQVFLQLEYFRHKLWIKSTHVLLLIVFFPRNFFRLWDNVEKFGNTGQATYYNIVWRMRFACRIRKSRDTHSEYVILLFQYNNRCKNAPVLRHTYIAHLVLLYQRLGNVCSRTNVDKPPSLARRNWRKSEQR